MPLAASSSCAARIRARQLIVQRLRSAVDPDRRGDAKQAVDGALRRSQVGRRVLAGRASLPHRGKPGWHISREMGHAVHGRHALAVGVEGELGDPREGLIEVVLADAGLGRRQHQRALGRIADGAVRAWLVLVASAGWHRCTARRPPAADRSSAADARRPCRRGVARGRSPIAPLSLDRSRTRAIGNVEHGHASCGSASACPSCPSRSRSPTRASRRPATGGSAPAASASAGRPSDSAIVTTAVSASGMAATARLSEVKQHLPPFRAAQRPRGRTR